MKLLSHNIIVICVAVFGLSLLLAPSSIAQTQQETLSVARGSSLPVSLSHSFDEMVVSDPETLQAAPVSDREFYIRGLEIGSTNILTYDIDGNLVTLFEVKVTPDTNALQSDLDEIFPEANLGVRPVADKVYISGNVPEPETLERVLSVAESHAPGRVINAIDTALPAQVLLEVRFVEAARDDIRELGLGSEINNPGNFVFLTSGNLVSGQFARTAGALLGQSGETSLDLTLQALEEKGVLRTLAEPNLVSRSGSPASFLAGGEFPIPVASNDGAISIEFRNFGVGLEFTPNVLREDRIIIDVSPEVSGLDPRNSIRLENVEIPALSVRRINTQVELGSGESFAIAGLIQNDFQASKSQTPILGDIPVLGSLFRSTRFINNETELVVIITPHLVKPKNERDLATPEKSVQETSYAEGIVFGQLEKPTDTPLGISVRQNIDVHSATSNNSSGVN